MPAPSSSRPYSRTGRRRICRAQAAPKPRPAKEHARTVAVVNAVAPSTSPAERIHRTSSARAVAPEIVKHSRSRLFISPTTGL
jgi:hypothetical protein